MFVYARATCSCASSAMAISRLRFSCCLDRTAAQQSSAVPMLFRACVCTSRSPIRRASSNRPFAPLDGAVRRHAQRSKLRQVAVRHGEFVSVAQRFEGLDGAGRITLGIGIAAEEPAQS